MEGSATHKIYGIFRHNKNHIFSTQAVTNIYKSKSPLFVRNLLSLISKVTMEDLKRVGELYFKPLFDVTKSRCAICCQPSKVDEIKVGFKE